MGDQVAFSDFAKLDLRVAEIVSVEPVDGSSKLLKVLIKVGGETRVLVAGIAEFYAPEQLVGKKIVAVFNLECRKIRGIESQGMLLAAASNEGDSVVKLVTVDDGAQDGWRIH